MSLIALDAEDHVARSARWTTGTESKSLTASWAGQNISLLFHGRTLKLRFGKQTERKDADNGGTPMIAISLGKQGSSISLMKESVNTFDPKGGEEITVIDNASPAETLVRIMLIDWASVLEISSLLVDSVNRATQVAS